MNRQMLIFLLALNLLGCEKSNLDDVREFFDKNKIGSSPDYGVMKFDNDHVISIHGFMDDLGTCQEIINAMNTNACKETDGEGCLNPYSCKPLNH